MSRSGRRPGCRHAAARGPCPRTLLRTLGLAVGVLIALVLGRFTASVLYGTSGTDPLTFAIVSAVLLAAATVAILIPAFRASHVEPTTALRYE